MNALVEITPSEAFRNAAADLLKDSAEMTLHELVDEYLRLTEVMDAGVIESGEEYRTTFNDEAKLAMRKRNVINGAARARFGVGFESYDRASGGGIDF